MRSGVLPSALLFAALGLALGCAPRTVWAPSLLALFAVLTAFSFVLVPRHWLEGVYLACWTSVIATALSVHFIRGLGQWVALALSLNVGVWASAVVHLSGSRLDVLKALPCVLMVFPASWLVNRGASIPV